MAFAVVPGAMNQILTQTVVVDPVMISDQTEASVLLRGEQLEVDALQEEGLHLQEGAGGK